jgi:type II secretory pathway component PulF
MGIHFMPISPHAAKAEVCAHLSVLLLGGLGAARAVEATRERVRSDRWREALESVLLQIRETGCPVAEAFFRCSPPVFDAAEVTALVAGEKVGRLAEVLKRLGERAGQQAERQRKVVGALVYPVALLLLAAVAGGVPLIASGQGGEAGWVIAGNLALVCVGLGWGAVLWRARARERGEAAWLAIPWVGRGLRSERVREFIFLFRLLVEAGLPWADAVEMGLKGSGSAGWSANAEKWAGQLREGSSLAEALREAFAEESETYALLASGEEAGRLPDSLQFIEEQLASRVGIYLDQTVVWLPRLAYICAMIVVVWQVLKLYGGMVRGYEEFLPAQ